MQNEHISKMKDIRKRKYFIAIFLFLIITITFYLSSRLNKVTDIDSDEPIQTHVIVYTPQISEYPKKDGECWTTSTALQGRLGTLRCSVGSSIIDPCFKLGSKIICDTNPIEEGDEFELIYDESELYFKDEVSEVGSYQDKNKRFSWIYLLTDGSYCNLIQGTAGSLETGEMYYYVCGNNKVIIGDVDKNEELWKADVGYLMEGEYSKLDKREFQTVIKAWE